jgi:hypothetical protein
MICHSNRPSLAERRRKETKTSAFVASGLYVNLTRPPRIGPKTSSPCARGDEGAGSVAEAF